MHDTRGTIHSMATMLAAFGPNIEFGRDLAPFSSFRTGGKARYFIQVESAGEVAKAIRAARQLSIPRFLLGGGTNILISDSGFDGVVIKLDVRGISLASPSCIECGAAEELMDLVTFAADHSLTGLEFAAGIFGTVGGAIYGNAGAYGSEIGSVVESITLVDNDGVEQTVDAEYCRFGYRDSYLKVTREVVTTARLRLAPGNQEAIRARIDEILTSREGKHPVDGMSAGCFFKNVPDADQPHGKLPAGKLLDEVGAKNLSVGGARVFDKHANIIVNTGNATSKDIRELADMMKKKVQDTFGITLEEEVQVIGQF